MEYRYTPQERLLHWAEVKPEEGFLFQPQDKGFRVTSWKEAINEISKVANYLKKFPEGSRIGILSLNCDSWIKADLAIMSAGHISVPIYPTASKQTVSQILDHAEIKLVFVGKMLEEPDPRIFSSGIELVGMFNDYPSYNSWESLLVEQEPLKEFYSPATTEIATIVYTSGTTGKPKGVVISYRALSEAFDSITKTLNVSGSERFFSYLPLAHVAERVAVEMGALFYGCRINFVRSLETFSEDLNAAEPTVFFGVPRIWLKFRETIERKLGGKTLFNFLIEMPIVGNRLKRLLVSKLGLDKAWLCLSGAASISEDTLRWFRRLGIQINEVYGMSETLGLATANTPKLNQLGTVGRPVEGCEVIVAENGEILLRTPSLMDGYYREPDLTAASIQDDWFRTGDLGEINSDGFLKITGRAKDLFKTSKGKYVSPIPIEEKLMSVFGSDQVCVMGEGFSQPAAVIVLEDLEEGGSHSSLLTRLKNKLSQVNLLLEKHERLDCIGISRKSWTPENNLMTPTLKIRRASLESLYQEMLSKMIQQGNQVAFLPD